MNIALGLLKRGNYYFLQLRNGSNQAGGLGYMGCFGGQLEPGESPLLAACRELAEETSFAPTVEQGKKIGEVQVISERHGKEITVHASIFEFDIDHNEVIDAKEGELVAMTIQDIHNSLERLTPATRACFTKLIKE